MSAEAARGAPPALTDSTLDVLEDEQTRARIAAVLATPELQQAMQEISRALTDGIVEGLSDERMSELVEKLSARLTGALVTSSMQAVAREIPQSIAPALRQAIVDELGPAFAATLRDEQLRGALGETSHEIARQAVRGSNAALAELAEQQRREEGGRPLGAIGVFFGERMWLLAVLGAALVFLIPIVWLYKEHRSARRYREETERRNARAGALLGAIEATGQSALPPELLAMLREQLLESPSEAALGERERPPPPASGPPRPSPA